MLNFGRQKDYYGDFIQKSKGVKQIQCVINSKYTSKKKSVRNLITFSIVSTNKNGMARF